jgi:hypothetical protein
MDPINPWLDAAEVRRLAERLMKPAHNPGANVSDAGFDEAFEGFASARAATLPSPQEAAPAGVFEARTESRADHSPPPPSPAPEPIASSARGPFLDRIHRFRDWMRQHFAATGLFILDREGSVIFDESNHGRLHFLARSLALASRRPGTSAGNVHVKIGAGATLEVIPVETAYGCLVLGAVVPESLSPASVSAVMEALTLVAAPPEI